MARPKCYTKPPDSRWESVVYCGENGQLYATLVPNNGAVFGRLTVVSSYGKGKQQRTNCSCECGRDYELCSRELRRGTIECSACGWVHAGLAHTTGRGHYRFIQDSKLRTRMLLTRTRMLQRCYDKKNNGYKDYGGRGISVCDEWRESTVAFLSYVVTLPGYDVPRYHIDRINNDGNYEPGNVRFVPASINCRNRRSSRFVVCEGVSQNLVDFWHTHCPEWRSINAVCYHLDRGKSGDDVKAIHDKGVRHS